MRFVLASIFALIALFPMVSAAQHTVSGRLLGSDGRPLPLAHVQHVTPEGRAVLRTARADADGQFEIELPGTATLRFDGVGHERLTTTFAFDATDPMARVTVRLGRPQGVGPGGLAYGKAQIDRDSTIDLTQLPDGSLFGELAVEGDSAEVAFTHLLRFTLRPFVPILPDQAYVFDGRSYAIKAATENGRVPILLDPESVPQAEILPTLSFENSASLAARYAELIARAAHRLRAERAASYVQMLASVDPAALDRAKAEYADLLAFDEDAEQRDLLAQYRAATHPLLRAALLVSYLDAGGEDAALSAEALRSIPARSPAWSIAPHAFADAAERTGGEAQHGALLDTALSDATDPRLVGNILLDRLRAARAAGRDDEARRLYARLTTEAARTKYASFARYRYAPDRPVTIGEPVPAFTLPILDAEDPVTEASLPGRITLLDFWATWCSPCIAERETLRRVYDRYHAEGFEIVSVSFDEARADVATFRAERWPMPWRHSLPEGGFDSAIAKAFDIGGLPTLILLDADGTVLATDVDLAGDALESTVRRALRE